MENKANETAAMLAEKYNIHLSAFSTNALADILVYKKYYKDETVLSGGKICRDFYIVNVGMLRQFYYKNGRNITEHFSCEGSIAFNIESLFLQKPSDLCMEAIEDSEVYLLNYADFKRLASENKEIGALLLVILEKDLIESQHKADSWRFETSHERYERFCREYPEASKRASIAHIASYLLMAPETLSRVRAGIL